MSKLIEIYSKKDNMWSYKESDPCSFVMYYDLDSAYSCKKILEGNKEKDVKDTFLGNVSVELSESVLSISVRYFYFSEFLEALLNDAIVVEYHGYRVIFDTSDMKFSDHRNGSADVIFNRIDVPVKFDFQIQGK